MQNIWLKLNFGAVLVLALLVAGAFAKGALGGPLDPPAAPAPTMKTLQEVEPRTPISSLPYTISTGGSYYVTGNLHGTSGQHGIIVSASDVSIDLNGFTLYGGPGSLDGISLVHSGGLKVVAIHNGVVRNWGGNGIDAQYAMNGRFEELQAYSNGYVGLMVGYVGLGENNLVKNCVSAYNGAAGVYFGGGTLDGCDVRANTHEGIVVDYEPSTVINNEVSANGAGLVAAGIVVNGSLHRIEGNNVTGNGREGIWVNPGNNVIVRNMGRQNGLGNFVLGAGNTFGPAQSQASPIANPWANIEY